MWVNYDNSMIAWMERTFSLVGYQNCYLQFDFYLDTDGIDYLVVYTDGDNRFEVDGDPEINWDPTVEPHLGYQKQISLSAYDDSTVTVKFVFISDGSGNQGYGAFLDNIGVYGDPIGTPPLPPANPSPGNGSLGISVDATLTWADGGGATNFDVYFGTDSTPDSGEFQGNQVGTSFDPGMLDFGTQYYWRIDAHNEFGVTSGDVWQFTTLVSVGATLSGVTYEDLNGDGIYDPSEDDALVGVFVSANGGTPAISTAGGDYQLTGLSAGPVALQVSIGNEIYAIRQHDLQPGDNEYDIQVNKTSMDEFYLCSADVACSLEIAGILPVIGTPPGAAAIAVEWCGVGQRAVKQDWLGVAFGTLITVVDAIHYIGTAGGQEPVTDAIIAALSCIDAYAWEFADDNCDGYTHCLVTGAKWMGRSLFAVRTGSPVDIRITNSLGQVLQIDAAGDVSNELALPGWIFVGDGHSELAVVLDPVGDFTVEIVGRPEAGIGSTFDLQIYRQDSAGSHEFTTYMDVPTSDQGIAVSTIGLAIEPVLRVDADGDGSFDDWSPLPDGDNDGVIDAQDACPNTILMASVDAVGCPPECPFDLERDGDVDLSDFALLEPCTSGPAAPHDGSPTCIDADVDVDGDVDLVDFAAFQRCFSGEGVPGYPECLGVTFGDCNTNGVPDSQDFVDCDGSLWCSDCNSNGVLDECDVAVGSSQDINANGIPDECDGLFAVGQWGGLTSAVAVSDDIAIVGVGPRLDIIDITTPWQPVLLSQSSVLPGLVADVAVVGNYAYVADATAGLQIVEISNPLNPFWVGGCDTGGTALGVAIADSYAYVAARSASLQVIDISSPFNPTWVGEYNSGGNARDVDVKGGYAYVAEYYRGLQVVDISDPAALTGVGSYNTSGEARGVAIEGNYAYVADNSDGLQVLSIVNPVAPVRVGGWETGAYALRVNIAGNYAYIADYSAGLQVIDVSQPENPVWLGGYDTSGWAYDVSASGDYVYVADKHSGLQVIDISNATDPSWAGYYDTSGYIVDAAVEENCVYAADVYRGLHVIDISNPASPVRLGGYDTSGSAYGVAVAGSYACVADGSAGLQVIDISNPASPARLGGYDTSGSAYGVAVAGSYAYVADGNAGLQVIDISNPASPVRLGGYDTSGSAYGVTVAGSYACVADGSAGLQVIDVSNPASPVRLGGYDTSGSAYGVTVAGSYACVADGSAGLQVIDVSNPASPVRLGGYDTSGFAYGVAVAGRYAYVADDSGGVDLIDIFNAAAPTLVGSDSTSKEAVGIAVTSDYAIVASESRGLVVICLGRYGIGSTGSR
jgi:hypothetical protein